MAFPRVRQTVLDTTDPRRLGDFYRDLLGWPYRPGDERPPEGTDDERGRDWLVLTPPDGGVGLAFQHVDELTPTSWPDHTVPQQLHLDMDVPDAEELAVQRDRALALGATIAIDRSDDEGEPLYSFRDPSGHLFCIFVA